MVYSLDILNTNISNDNIFAIQQNGTNNPAVKVFFNGSGIHIPAGPTPFVEFSSSVERNDIGEPLVINNKITLTGKVVKNSGIKNVMTGILGLKNIFKPNSCGLFKVTCDNTDIYSASGVRFVSLDFNKSNDNWVNTADYTAVLEYYEPAYTGWYVKSYNDSWNVEPLEDYIYSQDDLEISYKDEHHNPKIKPSLTNSANKTPNGASPQATSTIKYRNIPQFKISRTISAVGIPSGTGACLQPGSLIEFNKYPPLAVDAFLQAKRWVESRASAPFAAKSPTNASMWSPVSNGYMYNHLRAINFDVHSAKYELTDTWLAMPTGISFIEEYSLETSTDDKYIHTVSVQGEVRGLNYAEPNITGVPYVSGSGNPVIFDLSIGTGLKQYGLSPTPNIESAPDGTASNFAVIKISKYQNALSGWLNDIKPYLYRRASMAMNSKDRDRGYVIPNINPAPAPGNPIYCKHNVLNIIPVSTSETHNPKKGTISYTYQFNNKFTIISGSLYENVTMEDTGPAAVIGEAFVLGRALGPVLQSLNTVTSSKKSITIEVGVVPPTSINGFFMTHQDCPLWISGTIYKTISGMVEGFKPFGDRIANVFGSATTRANMAGQVYVNADNHTWEPSNGRYVRTVGWTYQQCNTNKNYMDH